MRLVAQSRVGGEEAGSEISAAGDGGSLEPQKSTSRSAVVEEGTGGVIGEGEAAACCCSSAAERSLSRSCCCCCCRCHHGEKRPPPPPPPMPPPPPPPRRRRSPPRRAPPKGSGGGSGPDSSAEASSGSSRWPPRIAGVENGQGAGRSSAAERASSSAEGGRPVFRFWGRGFEESKEGRSSAAFFFFFSHHAVEEANDQRKKARHNRVPFARSSLLFFFDLSLQTQGNELFSRSQRAVVTSQLSKGKEKTDAKSTSLLSTTHRHSAARPSTRVAGRSR